jgi:hypothetical protein
VIELLCCDDSFGTNDFADNATHSHFVSCGFVAPDITALAADPEVDFADGHGPAVRAEKPPPHQFRFGERIEHQPARGIEVPLDRHFAVGGCRDLETFGIEQHRDSSGIRT